MADEQTLNYVDGISFTTDPDNENSGLKPVLIGIGGFVLFALCLFALVKAIVMPLGFLTTQIMNEIEAEAYSDSYSGDYNYFDYDSDYKSGELSDEEMDKILEELDQSSYQDGDYIYNAA